MNKLLTTFLLLTVLGYQKQTLADPLEVFASILPIQYLVDHVGGERVSSEVMVKPGHSPATFEPSPKQMAALAQARLFIRIGVPFEKAWIEKIQSVNTDLEIIDVRNNGSQEAESHHDHRHDTHIWTDPLACIEIAEKIATALISSDPDDSNYYKQNLNTLTLELTELDQQIKGILAPLKQRRFMVFHPAWDHFSARYGLTQIAIEQEGKAPGSRALTKMITEAKKEHITKLLVQPQFDQTRARTIATAINAKLIEVDPLAYSIPQSLTSIAKALAAP